LCAAVDSAGTFHALHKTGINGNTENTVWILPGGGFHTLPVPRRPPEDRIRELFRKAAKANDSELEAIFLELRSALGEHGAEFTEPPLDRAA
jgi:hypothetical protein